MEENELRITIREIIVGLFVTIIGGIFVAWTIQEGGRFQQSNPTSIAPIFTLTPEITLTETPNYPYIIIKNDLLLPVKIYADDIYKGQVASSSTKTLMIEGFPTQLSWEVEKISNGKNLIGDDMEGSLIVSNGEAVVIQSTVGKSHYFFPILNNYSNQDCRVVINEGLGSIQQDPGYIKAYAQNVVFGYYFLASNSNITLYCGNQKSYWGSLPNGQGDSITKIIDPITGATPLLAIGSP